MTVSAAHPSTFDKVTSEARPLAEAVAVVGPNAVTQLVRVLRAATDAEDVQRILVLADVLEWADHPPDHMVDERPVAALHRATRAILAPDRSRAVLAEAGLRTGDYILSNRIPKAARAVLKILPAWMSSRLLARAITAHAWTFVGSGRFACSRDDGLSFEIRGNPFCAGETSVAPLCVWHAAVFQRLYQALVSPGAMAVETHCAARGDACCRFAVNGIGR
jgi:divinyl protochlorophyllide a 8-vinyl-reductase